MNDILIFGPGYAAGRVAAVCRARGARVTVVQRQGDAGALEFDDVRAVSAAIAGSTHILSSVPPGEGGDPVLLRHGAALAGAPARWIGYLSSTGVYGDTGGAWVDETAPVGEGRRSARTAADIAWQRLHVELRVFRLPGIYGPGRSALDRVRAGQARRIALEGQVFSRIHVEDIVAGVLASIERGPAGIYNLADDLPVSQNAVIEYACALMGEDQPPLRTLDEAGLSPMARAFYAENRRIANGKAKRLLGWRPRFPDHRAGLRAIHGAR